MTWTNVPSAATWSEQAVSDALQIAAEGLAELVGFGTVVISVRRGGEFVVVAVAGKDGAVRVDGTREELSDMLGSRWQLSHLEALLSVAEDWGRFKFIHHDRAQREWWKWAPAGDHETGPGEWHRHDGAIAPIHDADGVLRAAISVDEPRSGRYPDDAQRRVMDKYADQAAQVILSALEREALTGRLRLAARTREIIRTASRHLSLDTLLTETQAAFYEAFDASGLWVRVRPSAGGQGRWLVRAAREVGPPPDLAFQTALDARADQLWTEGRVAVACVDDPPPGQDADPSAFLPARTFLRQEGLRSAIHAPLGTPDGCFGSLIIGRRGEASLWSDVERQAVRDLGRDLGRLIVNARAFAEAEHTVSELRELDAYKSRLVSTISHELKNPLTVVLAHLDLLAADLADDPVALARVARVDANAQAMQQVVDNLLLLAKIADPDVPLTRRDVDLAALAAECEDRFAAALADRGIRLRVTAPPAGTVVGGDAAELRALLGNVVGNAIKFSPDGGTVDVALTAHAARVEVVVTDHGPGIAAHEQDRLFTDFFRSEDPAAQARAGSGLGLAIVERIARRHGGRVAVVSEHGAGSTFRVTLPALART